MTRKFFILFQLILLSFSLFEDDPNVEAMSFSDQQAYISKSDILVVSIIYENNEKTWHLSRTLKDVTDKLQHYVKFLAFDCGSEEGVCSESILKDLPAVNMFIPNKSFKTAKDRMTEKPYIGQISGKEIGEAIHKEIPYLGDVVDDKNIEEFLAQEGNKILLFTNKETEPLLYKGISSRYRDRIRVGLVFSNSSEIIEKFEVTDYPSLIAIQGEEKIRYKGKFEFINLAKFINDYAADQKFSQTPLEPSEAEEIPNSQAEEPEETKAEEKKTYISVDSTNFTDQLESTDQMALVHFHSEEAIKDWENIQKRYEGILKILDFQCDSFCDSLSLPKLPALRLYNSGKATDLSFKTLSDIDDRVAKEIKPVYSTIQSKSVQDLVNNLYSTGKVVCILISKSYIPLSFKNLAADPNLSHFVKFIHLDARQEELTDYFELPRFPIILTVFIANPSQRPQTLDFSGSLEEYPKLLEFVQDTTLPHFFRGREQISNEDLDEVVHLYDEKTWNSKCLKKKGFCLVGFTEENNNSEINVLRKVRSIFERRRIEVNVFWMDGKCSSGFREQLGFGNDKGLVFLQHLGKKVWTWDGGFNEQDSFGFIENALLGKTSPSKVEKVEFVKGDCDVGKPIKKKRIHISRDEEDL